MQKAVFRACSTLSLLITFSSSAAFAKAWSSSNHPFMLNRDWNIDHVELNLDSLPSKAALPADRTPWSSSYVPNQRNGFLYRPYAFQSTSLENQIEKSKDLYSYFKMKRPHSYSELRAMSLEEINQLSPIEKYSIYVGDYTYSLATKFPYNDPEDAYWQGYCDAWSMAAIGNAEPDIKTVIVGDVPLTFTSGDLKILLTANAYLNLEGPSSDGIFIGSRCRKKIAQTEPGRETVDTKGLKNSDLESYLRSPKFHLTDSQVRRALNDAESSACDDTNAGTFHLALTNQIGIHQKSFVFDVTRDVEIWNQPASSYVSEITPMNGIVKNAARGTKKNVRVKTVLSYADDTFYGWSFTSPTLKPTASFMEEYQNYEKLLVALGERESPGTYPEDIIESVTLEYILDLNENGEIIGGDWISYDRPDYIWIPKQAGINAHLSKLSELIK